MRYIIDERIFSIGNKFDIRTESGDVAYEVIGRVFSLGKKLELVNLRTGNELSIQQKLLKILREYRILRGEEELALIRQTLSFFRPKYNIESIYGDYSIEGDFIAYDFNINKDSRPVARISKKFFALRDSYSVDIEPGEDPDFILALVIILDQIHHDGGSGSN